MHIRFNLYRMSGMAFSAALLLGTALVAVPAAASASAPSVSTPAAATILAATAAITGAADTQQNHDDADANSEAQARTSIHPIRGFLPNLRFSLDGFQDKTVTEKNLEGKVVLLFFGYASCPDICPTTMAQLSQVVSNLGDQADQVQIVFVSVDPHRDTPDILHAYVSAFNDHAIGLTGNERQIADVARRYRVAYQIEEPTSTDPDSYEVTHARGIYIFDQKGRARLLASDSESVDSLTASIRELLS